MAKVTVNGFIYAKPEHDGETRFNFFHSAGMERHSSYVLVCAHALTFEVPDDFSLLPGYIAALERQKREAQEKLADAEEQLARFAGNSAAR